MTNKVLILVVVLSGFSLAIFGVSLVSWWGESGTLGQLAFTVTNRLFWMAGIPAFCLLLLYPIRSIPSELGLSANFLAATRFGFITTLPMLIGYGIAAEFTVNIDVEEIILGSLLAGVAEEICFRGFLFGQLYKRVGLWFPLAAGASAIMFGIGHLYQGNSIAESAGVFLITFVGGVWFSWLFVRWNFNIWVPIYVHVLMNLYWGLFNIDDSALGGVEANIYRAAVIALSIWLTIIWAKRDSTNAAVENNSHIKADATE